MSGCGNTDCGTATCGLDGPRWESPCDICQEAERLRERNMQLAADLKKLKSRTASINEDPLKMGSQERWGDVSFSMRNDLVYLAELGLIYLERLRLDKNRMVNPDESE